MSKDKIQAALHRCDQIRTPGGISSEIRDGLNAATDAMQQLQSWVDDLQSGMYVNCVYCGHRYGGKRDTIPRMTLEEHIAQCPKHPMANLTTENAKSKKTLLSAASLAIKEAAETKRLTAENAKLREVCDKAAEDLVQAQNQLHGVRHAGMAKREMRDVEKRLRKALKIGGA